MHPNTKVFQNLFFTTVLFFSATATGFAQANKVDVCHSEGNGSYQLINISDKAFDTHVVHGDGSPGGAVPGVSGKIFAEDCGLSNAPETIFDSIPSVYPGSFPSLGYEATSTDESGDHFVLAGTARNIFNVVVSLTNWACENDGTRANTDACTSTPGSSFSHAIALNLYEVDYTSGSPEPGALIATRTQNFDIPYRPSWDSANCALSGPAVDVPFGGRWYDPVLDACVHGFAFNISYDLSGSGIVLPDEIIVGVAFNTQHYGASPSGVWGPYNSLNLSYGTSAPTIGTDAEWNTAFLDSSWGGAYCDNGAGGIDFFRRDAGCWWDPVYYPDGLRPVVRIVAQ